MVRIEGKRVVFLSMKKYMFLPLLSGVIAGLFLSHMVLAASASAMLAVPQGTGKTGASVADGKLAPPRPGDATNQQNNQSFRGISSSGNSAHVVGSNEANSGNQGTNRGFSQDNSGNAGNIVSGQRKPIDVQENNQSFEGNGSGEGNKVTMIGRNQGNSGNEGLNFGHNQDNANNSGNQVNNQGNIIGTQINNQGTVVNNQGNTIGRQINYLSLLPGLRLSLRLRPLQVGLSTAPENTLPQTTQQHPNVAPPRIKTNG